VRYLIALTTTALFVVAACNGAVQPTPAEPGPDADVEAVSIFDLGYDPATLTVATGQTVTWTNDGIEPHTVTFDDGTDSGTLNAGDSYDRTFDAAGEFSYICTIHPAMTGVVNVGP
jgi:plastocyanin